MSERFDPANMFGAIWDFPDNLTHAVELGNKIILNNEYKNIQSIVVAGMGGSAIGGDVLSVLEKDHLSLPVVVSRSYDIPNWVNESTLVICSSYSGNTEETLTALEVALEKNAQICGITTGGTLANKLNELGKDIVLIPSGLQPRAALAYSFVPMGIMLQKMGILDFSIHTWLTSTIESLNTARELYSKDSDENPIYELAQQIVNRLPIIYADTSTLGIAAVRLKGQICENANMLAYHNELPEFNHNEIVGWENNQEINESCFVLWLTDDADHPRVKHRQRITQNILNEAGIDQYVIEMTGNSFQERFLHSVHYGDWLSYWCAILHGTDPSPVEKISRLKEELSKTS